MRRPIQALLIAASLLSSQAMAGPQEDQRARNAVRVLAEIQKSLNRVFRTNCSTKAAQSSSFPTRSRPAWSLAVVAATG